MSDPLDMAIEECRAIAEEAYQKRKSLERLRDFLRQASGEESGIRVATSFDEKDVIKVTFDLRADGSVWAKAETKYEIVQRIVPIELPEGLKIRKEPDVEAPQEAEDPAPVSKPIELPAEQVTYKTGPWSDEEEQAALDLDAQGISPGEIGVRLGRRGAGVFGKLRFLKRRQSLDAALEPAEDPAPEEIKEPEAKGPAPAVRNEEGGFSPPPRPAVARAGVRITSDGGVARDHTAAQIRSHLDYVYARDAKNKEKFWSAARDLALVKTLAAGDGITGAFEAMGSILDAPERGEFVARFKFICPEVTVKNQALLIEALSARV